MRNRKNYQARQIEMIPNYINSTQGSCLVSFGETKVLCAATIEDRVPIFVKGTGKGWVSAEYSLLPQSTFIRSEREAIKGRQNGRTIEIQRLISRSLRSAINLEALGERQIRVDCDVIQADGGTRTASICGACVAIGLAVKKMHFRSNPFIHLTGAISCGIVNGEILLDLDYNEDSKAEVDANFVMLDSGSIVEVQATGEKGLFSQEQLITMMAYSKNAINEIFEIQKKILLN